MKTNEYDKPLRKGAEIKLTHYQSNDGEIQRIEDDTIYTITTKRKVKNVLGCNYMKTSPDGHGVITQMQKDNGKYICYGVTAYGAYVYEPSIEEIESDETKCPHCGSKNIVDKYGELYAIGQTAKGCADPIMFCLDCDACV